MKKRVGNNLAINLKDVYFLFGPQNQLTVAFSYWPRKDNYWSILSVDAIGRQLVLINVLVKAGSDYKRLTLWFPVCFRFGFRTEQREIIQGNW